MKILNGITLTGIATIDTNSLVVGTNQLIAANGRIGIGLTNTATFGLLSIQGQTNGTIVINRAALGTGATPAETELISATNANGVAKTGIYAVNSLNSNNSHWLTFKTSDSTGTTSERLRIDSAGNVGIGTPTPAAKLDVVGEVRTSSRFGYGASAYTQYNSTTKSIDFIFA